MVRDGRDESAQGKNRESDVKREREREREGRGDMERSDKENDRREGEMRRRDTLQTMEARARCAPLSLFSSFLIFVSRLLSLSLYLLFSTSLSLSSLFSVTRQHIYVCAYTLAYTFVSLTHPLPLPPLFFSFSSLVPHSVSVSLSIAHVREIQPR